jgi:hypothetical protein
MSLITACAIFCSLKFHVVCTCTFFGDTICLLTNQKIIKIVTLIDSHIVLAANIRLLTLLSNRLHYRYLSVSCESVVGVHTKKRTSCNKPACSRLVAMLFQQLVDRMYSHCLLPAC